MKRALLFLLFLSSALLAQTTPAPQVPAHSVIGSLTIDVADVDIPVPYGTTETKAVISACSSTQANRIQMNIAMLFPDGTTRESFYDLMPPVNTANGYCASMVAMGPRAKIAYVYASAINQVSVTPPPATSGSTEAQRR
jgi:hypothetical protein